MYIGRPAKTRICSVFVVFVVQASPSNEHAAWPYKEHSAWPSKEHATVNSFVGNAGKVSRGLKPCMWPLNPGTPDPNAMQVASKPWHPGP